MDVAMGVAGLRGNSTTGGPFTQAGEGVGWRTAIRSWGRVAARLARQQPSPFPPRDHADRATLGCQWRPEGRRCQRPITGAPHTLSDQRSQSDGD